MSIWDDRYQLVHWKMPLDITSLPLDKIFGWLDPETLASIQRTCKKCNQTIQGIYDFNSS
jgi:hypothetical protein